MSRSMSYLAWKIQYLVVLAQHDKSKQGKALPNA
jgi:hypothetical protein